MSMAAVVETRATSGQTKASRIAGIDVLHDLASAEPIWRRLESEDSLASPYQRFDFLAPWQTEVGQHANLTPFIVTGHDASRAPLFLLPLVLKQEHGVRTACFMGGKHTTFNMGLWNREFAAAATAGDLGMIVSDLRARSLADVLALSQQPARWRGQTNPLSLLPGQASANDCPVLIMEPGAPPTARISNSFRRRLKGKERKFQASHGYRYHVAADEADIHRILDWFFRIKPQRMAEQKLPNVFAEPGVEAFIRAACLGQVAGGHAIDIHALECDAEIIAIFAGVADGERFSMMFNTYTLSENARYSPGLVLMRNIIDYYAERSYRALDLGIGSDEYKRLFCKEDEPIFDCYIPLSARGRLAAAAMSGVNRAKHLVKHNPALLQMAQRLRSAFHR